MAMGSAWALNGAIRAAFDGLRITTCKSFDQGVGPIIGLSSTSVLTVFQSVFINHIRTIEITRSFLINFSYDMNSFTCRIRSFVS